MKTSEWEAFILTRLASSSSSVVHLCEKRIISDFQNKQQNNSEWDVLQLEPLIEDYVINGAISCWSLLAPPSAQATNT